MQDTLLIVTNGDSAVQALRSSGIPGELLAWDDVLHDGPVPGTLSPVDLATCRAGYLAGELAEREIERQLLERDAVLAAWVGPILLWFEHDLYDQLQLIQVLDRLAGRPEVWMVPETDFVAMQAPRALNHSFQLRLPVTEGQFEHSARAWRAFTASTPEAFVHCRGSDLLPHLDAAIDRWVEEFPGSRGLTRTEGEVIDALAGGARTGVELFRATQEGEAAAFRGDWSFWRLLDDLGGLIERDPASTAGPADGIWSITEAGRRVADGSSDRVQAIGIDLWRGGTHLTPANDWRRVGGTLRRA